jgi:hypothetical protein
MLSSSCRASSHANLEKKKREHVLHTSKHRNLRNLSVTTSPMLGTVALQVNLLMGAHKHI